MNAEKARPLRAALVGCGAMGRGQGGIVAGLDEFELTAVCDVLPENAQRAAEATGAKAFADFDEMVAAERPDVVCVCTANDSHASLTIRAAEAGARGVFCEKPMATCLPDARAMVEACERTGAPLVVNHQRRIGPDLVRARQLIEAGAIGEVRLLRVQCAGDVLSDGTHAIDSALFLAGDAEVEWVFGQVHRDVAAEAEAMGRGKSAERPGYRYGHPVETGAMAVFRLAGGLRVELFCGDLCGDRRAYQDYEVLGRDGRLWRTGDAAKGNLFIQDARGGDWAEGLDGNGWPYKPIPPEAGRCGAWRPVELGEGEPSNPIADAYRLFARQVAGERLRHPMSGENALRGFEVVMAIYESARLNQKLRLPIEQERFPLELMIEQGRLL
ncbi:MAG TPA: Gfo/Idh/MocA family oxidoreductase [Phycisphaerae bacterium]|nr:Gfo/Idh/MocA family oxidoreductase [Phycisphaerae bacterium]